MPSQLTKSCRTSCWRSGAATLLMKASRSYEAKAGDASPPFATSACTAWRMGINFFSCFGVKFNCLTIRLQLLLLTGVLSLRLGCKRDEQTESQGEGSDSCGQISSWVLSLHFLRHECEFSFWLPTARHDYRISVFEARAVDHTALGGGTYVQNCSLWPKITSRNYAATAYGIMPHSNILLAIGAAT